MTEQADDLTEAESVALVVAGVIQRLQNERDEAQGKAGVLAGLLLTTQGHLEAMVDLATRQGTSWAKDDLALSHAKAHLESLAGVESDQSPEQEPTT